MQKKPPVRVAFSCLDSIGSVVQTCAEVDCLIGEREDERIFAFLFVAFIRVFCDADDSRAALAAERESIKDAVCIALREGVSPALLGIAVRAHDAQRAVLRRAGEGGEVDGLTCAVDGLRRRPVVAFNGQCIAAIRLAAARKKNDEQQRQQNLPFTCHVDFPSNA